MGPHDFAYTLLKSGGKVLLLVTDKEHSLHHLPSEEEETNTRIDYESYTSPDPDTHLFGILAASTIKHVANAMVCNVLRSESTLAIESLTPIKIPDIKTYSYIAASDEAGVEREGEVSRWG